MWEVHKRTQQGVSAELEFYIYSTPGPYYWYLHLPLCLCYILMSVSFPTQGYYVVYMCPDIIFQVLSPSFRLMMLHPVTCHVTVMSCASSSSKRKRKQNQKNKGKRNKNHQLSKASYNTKVGHLISTLF